MASGPGGNMFHSIRRSLIRVLIDLSFLPPGGMGGTGDLWPSLGVGACGR